MEGNTTNSPQPQREMTYGEKAVGLTFNPGGSAVVDDVKKKFAEIIDTLCASSAKESNTDEREALVLEAIRQCQSAQMWVVKAVTFLY
jgi:hypothetical protein